MSIQDSLNNTKHRPWALPQKGWQYYQEWNKAIFLHYQVNLEDLQKWLPQGLELDLYEGHPWVSIVAFTMERIRPKYLTSMAMISNFDEVNIRTYVKFGNKAGVYFLSIEGGKLLSCKIAKSLSQLPYRFSNMQRGQGSFSSRNTSFQDQLDIHYKIGQAKSEKNNLDRWLTERYALFQDAARHINTFEIHHVEWLLNELEIKSLNVNYPRFYPLFESGPSKVQYSPGVQVLAWGKERFIIKK